MLEPYTDARLTEDYTFRRSDGRITTIRAGTTCAVLDVYHTPPGYELDFDYEGEEFNIGVPADIVASL